MQAVATRKFTTNLSEDIFDFISQEAKSFGLSQRKFLENILKKYKKEKLRREILQGYNDMACDTEEMNMWLDIANNPENLKLPKNF